MRVVADLASNEVVQVEKTPEVDGYKPFNGRYLIPMPEPGTVDVEPTSYILPVDGGDLSSLAMQRLLAQFPMYDNVAFNPLLTSSDVFDLEASGALGPSSEIIRMQTGRGSGSPLGQAPTTTAILPQNTKASPSRPGCIVTKTIDITAATGGVGADEFMVWWKLYKCSTSHDIMSDYGATAGTNSPAIRSIAETDQEPAGLTVYISNDDGATWYAVGRQQPTDLVVFDTRVRLAFVNTSSDKLYLASYAILF